MQFLSIYVGMIAFIVATIFFDTLLNSNSTYSDKRFFVSLGLALCVGIGSSSYIKENMVGKYDSRQTGYVSASEVTVPVSNTTTEKQRN